MHCFVYQAQSAVAKSGKPYFFQTVEVFQRPRRPNVEVMHFLKSLDAAMEPGEYEADVDFVASQNGPKPVFHSFRVKAN